MDCNDKTGHLKKKSMLFLPLLSLKVGWRHMSLEFLTSGKSTHHSTWFFSKNIERYDEN